MRNIKIFESKKVRTHWDKENEQWFFSVIDVIEILTGNSIPKRYRSNLKKKLAKEGSQLYEKIVQLKFEAAARENRQEPGKQKTDFIQKNTIFSLKLYYARIRRPCA